MSLLKLLLILKLSSGPLLTNAAGLGTKEIRFFREECRVFDKNALPRWLQRCKGIFVHILVLMIAQATLFDLKIADAQQRS